MRSSGWPGVSNPSYRTLIGPDTRVAHVEMRLSAALVTLALALANAKQFCADLLAPCYLMDYPESFAEMFCDR